MATNGDEQPISFEEFDRMARFQAKPPIYVRNDKRYHCEIVINGVRGWAAESDKNSALTMAIKSGYRQYCDNVWQRNIERRTYPILFAAEKQIGEILAGHGVKLDNMHWQWQYHARQDGNGGSTFWRYAIRANYEVSLPNGGCKRYHTYFEIDPLNLNTAQDVIAPFMADFQQLDLADIRHISALRDRLTAWRERNLLSVKVRKIRPAEAEPGDMLVAENGSAYFQVWKVSPSGSKIMVYRPFVRALDGEPGIPLAWGDNFPIKMGPHELERIDKDEREQDYWVMTYDQFVRTMQLGWAYRKVSDKLAGHLVFGAKSGKWGI